eukprot:44452-Prorocentrum_lima.AAC.1
MPSPKVFSSSALGEAEQEQPNKTATKCHPCGAKAPLPSLVGESAQDAPESNEPDKQLQELCQSAPDGQRGHMWLGTSLARLLTFALQVPLQWGGQGKGPTSS